MKKSILFWQLLGFAFTILLGTVFHFLYNWSNKNIFVAPFCAINESTWEHMKLLYFPALIFALIQKKFTKKDLSTFWKIKFLGTFLGLIAIPTIFYTYNGIIGKSPDIVNIIIFFISVSITYFYEYKQFTNSSVNKSNKLYFLLFITIGITFIIFTFCTPAIQIFLDPITKTYGIN